MFMMTNYKMCENYESPAVELIEVLVEMGFASSGEVNPEDYGWGGNLN